MKCHYIYVEDVGKVLIPGCMGTAARGIEYCTCEDDTSIIQFEKRKYNEVVNKMRSEISCLEKENNRLNNVIKGILKTKENSHANIS